jgi:hypothetical protein
VITPLRKTAGAEGVSATVENYLQSLQAKAGNASFSELHGQRKFLDDLLYSANRQGSENVKALRDVRRILEGEITRASDAAAKEIGGDFANGYKVAKENYRAAALIEKATTKGAERELANRSLGLSEQLGALGGSNAGATLGGALAGPIGAAVGGLVGGVSSAYVQSLTKRFGDQAVASALRRIAGGASPAAAFGGVVEEATGKAVAGFFKGAGRKALELTRGVAQGAVEGGKRGLLLGEKTSLDARYTAARDTVAKMGVQPGARPEAVKAAIPGAAPEVIQSAQETAQRSARFLAAKIPPNPTKAGSLSPQLDKTQPSKADQAKFLDYFDTVDDPTSALRSLEKGRITPQQVEALQAVYPEMYRTVQQQVMDHLQGLKEPLPYQQRIKLGVLLQIPTDPTLQPAFVQAIQGIYAAQPEQGQGLADKGRAPTREIHLSRAYETTQKEPL